MATLCLCPPDKLIGFVGHAVGKFDRLQGLAGDVQARRFLDAAVDQRQLDIVQRRGTGQQMKHLENEADLLVADISQFILGQGTDLLAVDEILALDGRVQAAQQIHQRGFSRTRLAHDGNEFPALHHEIDVFQGVDLFAADLIGFAEVLNFDNGGHLIPCPWKSLFCPRP